MFGSVSLSLTGGNAEYATEPIFRNPVSPQAGTFTRLGDVSRFDSGEGGFTNQEMMENLRDETNSKAWGLWITPRQEDIQHQKRHINTRAESNSSKGHSNVTLIKFTAEVTMGADLYAEWAKDGKFNMPGAEWKTNS